MNKLKLKKPLEYCGVKYEEIEYDLDSLTGDDLLIAEAEMNATGVLVNEPYLAKSYQATVFARAAKIDSAMMRKLGVKDFTEATSLVLRFFGE